jgi:hypothetical protein
VLHSDANDWVLHTVDVNDWVLYIMRRWFWVLYTLSNVWVLHTLGAWECRPAMGGSDVMT